MGGENNVNCKEDNDSSVNRWRQGVQEESDTDQDTKLKSIWDRSVRQRA